MGHRISEDTDNRKTTVLLFLLIVFLGTALYFRTLQAPFLFDDRHSIAENDLVRDFHRSLSSGSQLRYIGTLSFAVNYAISGLKVYGYHLTNVVIHICNAFLVYLLVFSLLRSPGIRTRKRSPEVPAFLAAFFFVAHPLHTQAVSYISQRFTSLAILFYLVSICCYVRARTLQETTEPEGKKGSSWTILSLYILSLIAAVLAMKTKEISATLPVMAASIELFFFRCREKRLLPYTVLVVLFVITGIVFAMPTGIFGGGQTLAGVTASISSLSRETTTISRADYFITQLRVIVTYLRLFFLPVNQNIDYLYPIYRYIAEPAVMLCLPVYGVLLGFAVWTWQRYRIISFGILWFFIALSVESSVIPIRDVVNEHRMYLPSVGLIMTCVAAGEAVLKSARKSIAVFGIIVLLFSLTTFARNEIWRSPEKLWADTVAKAPYNIRALNNLGTVYKEEKDYAHAIQQYNAALQLDETFAPAIYNLGDVQYQLGNYAEALAYLTRAETSPADPLMRMDILNKLGRTYGAMKRFPEAIEILEKARTEFPFSTVILNNLGVQYIKNGQSDHAVAVLEQALRIREEHSLYTNLSVAYAGKGEQKKAEEMLQKAYRIQMLASP